MIDRTKKENLKQKFIIIKNILVCVFERGSRHTHTHTHKIRIGRYVDISIIEMLSDSDTVSSSYLY
jgi:hypothetical protein